VNGLLKHRDVVMVVDDDITNLKFAKNILSGIYDVFTVPSAKKMFGLLETRRPSLIILDINMPDTDGLETLKLLKGNARTRDIPVIFLTARSDPESEVEGLSLGAVDYVIKPFEPHALLKRVEIHLTMESQRKTLERQKDELRNFNENLKKMVREEVGKVMELQSTILNTLADLVESRDGTTGGHVLRTQKWIGILVDSLRDTGVYTDEIGMWDKRLLVQSSQLHDAGKISISDRILLKPGRLTAGEFEEIKRHTVFGVRIIDKICRNTSESSFLEYAKVFAGTHHEKWDGSGYPDGLRGEGIPLQGRLMAVADVYDALISDRPYKKAFSHEDAVRVILNGSGTHFDPAIVDCFRRVESSFRL
jgi:putative two-component system response regulator